MKKVLLGLIGLLISTSAMAQCVAEVKSVTQDELRGSIVVETQYKLNGVVVGVRGEPDPDAIGRTRYDENSGTVQEIRDKAQQDIEDHCGNLIIRNAIKVNDLKGRQLEIAKQLTSPLITQLQNAVGWTKTVNEKVIQFKNKEITIEASGNYTVSDIAE